MSITNLSPKQLREAAQTMSTEVPIVSLITERIGHINEMAETCRRLAITSIEVWRRAQVYICVGGTDKYVFDLCESATCCYFRVRSGEMHKCTCMSVCVSVHVIYACGLCLCLSVVVACVMCTHVIHEQPPFISCFVFFCGN